MAKRFGRPVAATLVFACALTAAASAGSAAPSTHRHCKFVTKRIHGKKRRVRVCTKPKKPTLPAAASPTATIQLPGHATAQAIAATDTAVWVVTDDYRLFKIDPASNTIVATLTLPDAEWPEANVAVGDGAVWVTVASPSTISQPELDSVVRIDPQTTQIVGRIHVGHSPEGIAITPDAVWTANHRAEWDGANMISKGIYDVSRVDPASDAEVARPVVETRPAGSLQGSYCCGPQGMTFAAGSVWVTDPHDVGNGAVLRIDPATNAVTQISLTNTNSHGCGTMAGDDRGVWFASGCDDSHVGHIDPQTNRLVATIDLGSTAQDIAMGFGSVWAISLSTLDKIDPATNKIVGRTTIGAALAVAAGAGSIWAGSGTSVVRLAPR